MSLFIVVAAIPMGITIVWCYCHATSQASPAEPYYYGGHQSYRRRQEQRQQQEHQRQGSLWRPSPHQRNTNSAEEQARLNRRVRGSTSSSDMIPYNNNNSSTESMNIHEDSFEREDVQAEGKEQRLNCYQTVLHSCLQIVIFLWL